MAKSKVLQLDVEERTQTGTSVARRMRREGRIPAVLYGRDSETRSLTLSADAVAEIVHHPGMMELATSNGDTFTAILKDMQQHPITRNVLHMDLITVKADEMVQSTVTIYPHGIPAGAGNGGQLEQILHELEIECLPADLPEFIEIEVSHLKLDESIHVSELVLPEGIKAISDDELAVFQVRLPQMEEEEEEEEGAEMLEGEEGALAEGEEPAEGEESDDEEDEG